MQEHTIQISDLSNQTAEQADNLALKPVFKYMVQLS